MRSTIPFALLGGAVALAGAVAGTALPAGPVLAQPAAPAPGAEAAPPPRGGGPGGPRPEGRGPGRRGPGQIFNEIDANGDGRIVWDEVWVFVERRFAAADSDRDGGLTQEEMQAALRQMFAPPGRRGPGAGGAEGGAPAGAAAPGAAPGPDGGRGGPDAGRLDGAMFRALDADRNGRVTLIEIRPFVEARFRGFDANMDNAITRDELPQPPPRQRGPGPDGERRGPGPDGERRGPPAGGSTN